MNRLRRGLHKAGVLGINRRNAEYTLMYNPRRLYPLVDDKLRTKELALKAGIAVPELYAVVEIEKQIRELHENLREHSDFVIKPARGSGGDGILVISGRARKMYRKISGVLMTEQELDLHVSNILSGVFSLGGSRIGPLWSPGFGSTRFLSPSVTRGCLIFGLSCSWACR